jgi:hypothetical protein
MLIITLNNKMEKHMYILKELLIYAYKQRSWFIIADDIRNETKSGKVSIRYNINNVLKQHDE